MMPHPSEHNMRLEEIKRKAAAADPVVIGAGADRDRLAALTVAQKAVSANIPVIRSEIDRNTFASRCVAHSAAAAKRILGR